MHTDVKIDPATIPTTRSGEIAAFMETSLFRDFITELDIRIAKLKELLDDQELEYTGRHYDIFRGGMRNMREMQDIFNDLYQIKFNEEETQKEKKNG